MRAQDLLAAGRCRISDESGAVLIIIAGAMALIIAIAAFSIDVATLQSAREKAQVAADAGALAGAQDLTSNTTTTSPTATADAKVYVQHDDPNATPTVTAPYSTSPQDHSSVKVTVSKPVHLQFAGLFGLGTVTVHSSAVATSNLTTALGYFGDDTSDLQDGSATSDGWVNFCSNDANSQPTGSPATTSFSASGSSDPQRCPSGDSKLWSLDGWTVVHGGVDISQKNFFSPPNTTDQMVDLTGTCVEDAGTYPTGTGGAGYRGQYTSIGGARYDGYCENNADGELEEAISTEPGATYTVSFYMGANTWGYPYEKSMLMVASNQDLLNFPPMADTNGGDGYHSSSNEYGTVYPLESSTYSSDWGSAGIFASEEFVYVGPTNDTDPNWEQETFAFKATQSTTYLGFGALTNCAPDWTSSSNLSNTYFWFNPSSVQSQAGGTVENPSVASSSTIHYPPAQVHDDNQSPWQDQCKYGPGISDLTVTGPNAIQLTQ